MFDELGAEVIAIGVEPDGLNINQACGSTQPELLQKVVLEHHADVGIALDGDGDRVIMVDHKGELVDGDELLFIIARSRQQEGKLQGGVVGTLMSNLGLEHALQSSKIDFVRANVGDRYVLELMQQTSSMIGGESSGHIICLDRTTTGDGIVSALAGAGRPGAIRQNPARAERRHEEISAADDQCAGERRCRTGHTATAVQDAVRSAEQRLAGRGRVLLRPSGTEPLVRVMVEGEDAQQVSAEANQLASVVAAAV